MKDEIKDLISRNAKLENESYNLAQKHITETNAKENYIKLNDHYRRKGDKVKEELVDMRIKHDKLAQHISGVDNTFPKTTIPNTTSGQTPLNQFSKFESMASNDMNTNTGNVGQSFFTTPMTSTNTTDSTFNFGRNQTGYSGFSSTTPINPMTTSYNNYFSNVPLNSFATMNQTSTSNCPGFGTTPTNLFTSTNQTTPNLFTSGTFPVSTSTNPNTTTTSSCQTTAQNTVPTFSQNTSGPYQIPIITVNRNPSTKPRVPTFDGDFEGALNWFRKFQQLADYYQWTDEEKVKHARLNLVGSAENWYTVTFLPMTDIDQIPFVTEPQPTWTEFSQKFFQEYRPKSSRLSLRKKLINLTKNSSETYIAYSRRVVVLIRSIDPQMPEDEQVMYILEGLKRDPIYNNVRIIDNLDELDTYFIKFDKTTINVKPNPRNSSKNENASDLIPEKEDLPFKTNQKIKNSDVECLNCKKMGHFVKACPYPLIDRKILKQRFEEKKAQRSGENWSKSKTDNTHQNVNETELEITNEELQEADEIMLEVKSINESPPKTSNCGVITLHTSGVESENTARNQISKQIARAFSLPKIKVKINGICFKAMLDTGSSLSFISDGILHEINPEVIAWPFTSVKAVDQREVTPRYITKDLEITLEKRSVRMSLGIMTKMSFNVILGVDFVNKMNLGIDIPMNRVFFSDIEVKKTTELQDIIDEDFLIISELKDTINQLNGGVEVETIESSDSKTKISLSETQISESTEDKEETSGPKFQKETPDLLNCSSIQLTTELSSEDYCSINNINCVEEPKPDRIIPRVNKEYLFKPSERQLITTRLNTTHPGLFLTKTLSSAKRRGWSVEKGVISANNTTLRVWVQNKSLQPKRLKIGDSLFSLHLSSASFEDLIDIKVPEPPIMTERQKRRTKILERNKIKDYDSYNQKIWEKLNSVPSSESVFLTELERELPNDDSYFTDN